MAAGSGKSHLLMMKPLPYMQDPNFNGIFFRRVTKQLTGLGGIWQESQKMYKPFKPTIRLKDLTQQFPSGATLQFQHMELEKDKESHQGLQYSFIGMDELTHFSETMFTYLVSRLRSDADTKSFMMATCNPDEKSWVLDWVDWWLDDEGYPDPEKKGVVRYFVTVDDKPVFGESPERLKEEYPDLLQVYNEKTGKFVEIEPFSITFIGGTIFDNQILIDKNPKYLSALNSLPRVQKARLLNGNWYVREEGTSVWKREWVRGDEGERVKTYDDVPKGLKFYRGYDKGYSEPSEKNRYPDYTAASSKIAKDTLGQYWLIGDYESNFFDNDQHAESPTKRILGRVRKVAGERDTHIIQQAHRDGDDTTVVLTKDSGGAATDHTYTLGRLVENGIKVVEDTSAKNTLNKKLTDFQPFANACRLGLVFIVEESFNPITLKKIYQELEGFDPNLKSSGIRKDDWVDAHSLSFNQASTKRVHRPLKRNQKHSPTAAAELLTARQVDRKSLKRSTIPSPASIYGKP